MLMVHNVASARPARRWKAAALAATVLAVVGLSAGPASAGGSRGLDLHKVKKVSICRATGDRANPYTKVDVDVDLSTALHLSRNGQAGPAFSGKHSRDKAWGDVIPPFELIGGGHFGGKNWDDAGGSIAARGCRCPDADKPDHPDKPDPPDKPSPGPKPTPDTKPSAPTPPVTHPVASTVAPAPTPTSTAPPTTAVKASST